MLNPLMSKSCSTRNFSTPRSTSRSSRSRAAVVLLPLVDSDPEQQSRRDGLFQALNQLGWVDGRNITIEHRFSGDGRERIWANAKELVALNPDVIMGVGGPVLAALLAETRTIPIVFTNVNDPVGSGFVASLARPGGNATGVAVSEAPIAGKWLELLKEVAPQVTRVMVLMEADARPQQLRADTVEAAYQRHDWPGMLRAARHAAAATPTVPRALYNLACAEALNGHAAATAAAIDRLTALGTFLDLAHDDDLRASGRALQVRRLAPHAEALEKSGHFVPAPAVRGSTLDGFRPLGWLLSKPARRSLSRGAAFHGGSPDTGSP